MSKQKTWNFEDTTGKTFKLTEDEIGGALVLYRLWPQDRAASVKLHQMDDQRQPTAHQKGAKR
jgi:hypothetical protein